MIVVASSSTKPCSTSLEAVSRAIAAFSSAPKAHPLKSARQCTATATRSFTFQRRVLGACSGASRSGKH